MESGKGIGTRADTATGAYSAAADAHTRADSITGTGIGTSTGTAADVHTSADTSIGNNSGASTPEPAGELLVTGSTKHIWVSREWKPARLDRAFPELFAVLPNIAESSS
jgi:hypothetical protein